MKLVKVAVMVMYQAKDTEGEQVQLKDLTKNCWSKRTGNKRAVRARKQVPWGMAGYK